MIVDLFLVYQFIRRLATPFNKWDAYKLGIIDETGKVLIKKKDFKTAEQKKAWGIFDTMVANIKKLLAKAPGGGSKLASYAAALYLIREWNHFTDQSLLTDEVTEDQLLESLSIFNDIYVNYTLVEGFNDIYVNYTLVEGNVNKKINIKPELEETPVNSVGGGNIAGLDATAFSKEAQKKWTSQNKVKKKTLKDMRGVLNK
jgi:hypothetical protein